ncbi:hypothetical protein SPHINGOT1_220010 [Sphingomonas sp. T1]|nr:hypothetical protein SPHINGOT1_220010 [Sphingomonas sp. T1]
MGDVHVPDVHARTPADAEADRDQHDVAAAEIGRGESADEIEPALDRGEALVELLGVVEVVDQHEDLVRVAADVEADRRPGPVDRLLALDLVIHQPRAVAHAEDERARRLAAGDIGIGLALVLQDVLEDAAEPGRALAEHALARGKQVVALIGVGGAHRRLRARRRAGARRGRGRGGGLDRLDRRGLRIALVGDLLAPRWGGAGLGREIPVDRLVGIDRADLCGRAARDRRCEGAEAKPETAHDAIFPNAECA